MAAWRREESGRGSAQAISGARKSHGRVSLDNYRFAARTTDHPTARRFNTYFAGQCEKPFRPTVLVYVGLTPWQRRRLHVACHITLIWTNS